MLCMQRLIETMDNMTIDAFVYPGWGNPPRLIGDLQQTGNTPLGNPCHSAVKPPWYTVTAPMTYCLETNDTLYSSNETP